MNTIKRYWTMVVGSYRFHKARKEADAQHCMTGKRYYVVPSGGGKLMVVNRGDVERMKKAGVVKRSFRHIDLMNTCLYYTDSNGKDKGRMEDAESKDWLAKWLKHLVK